jgi:predicted nucleic acid-binding Zn finger protein
VEKAEDALASGSVKLHLFLPSGRKLWTVVGKEGEYWVDPELSFCSCKDYYFATLSGGGPCYHLKSVENAAEEGLEALEFSDGDYDSFLQALAAEAENALR